jgi:hypothetical protein
VKITAKFQDSATAYYVYARQRHFQDVIHGGIHKQFFKLNWSQKTPYLLDVHKIGANYPPSYKLLRTIRLLESQYQLANFIATRKSELTYVKVARGHDSFG